MRSYTVRINLFADVTIKAGSKREAEESALNLEALPAGSDIGGVEVLSVEKI